MKAFIIYLKDRPHSVAHSQYMLETLKTYGIDAELFDGVPGDRAAISASQQGRKLYPYSIKNRILDKEELRAYIKPDLYDEFINRHFFTVTERQKIGKEHTGKLSSPGVIGCFLSHYSLWRRCIELEEPIMIFEDDVKFYRPYETVDFEDVLILSLGKSSFMEEPYKTYLENPQGPAATKRWRNYSMPGASGYALTPKAAKRLVKFYRNYFYPADNAINQSIVEIEITTKLMGRNLLADEGNISMTKAKWNTEQ